MLSQLPDSIPALAVSSAAWAASGEAKPKFINNNTENTPAKTNSAFRFIESIFD